MELKEAIYGRRSIRKYKSDPVSDQDIKEILEAGMMAPSAVNQQPWYFVVVKSQEKIDEIVSVMSGASDKLVPSLKERFPNHPEVVEDTRKFVGMLGNAPLCILVFLHKPHYVKKESTMIQSVAAAIQNMLLTAYARGLGSCWLTAPLEAGADNILKERFAPDKGDMIALLTFGYAEIEPRAPRRKTDRYEII